MRDYCLFTDSTADLTPEMTKEWSISIVPIEVIFGETGYLDFPDEREITKEQFYERLRAGERATTSMIPPARFHEAFRPVVESGKDILYIGFSSALSGTLQNARIAADELKKSHPDSQIIVVDTCAVSMGEGALVLLAAEEKKKGKSIREVAKVVEDNRLKICLWFSVDDLQHLRRGGRLSTLSAVVGSALGIKPILRVDDEGSLELVDKVRGRQAALDYLFDKAENDAINPAESTFYIAHADCDEDRKRLEKRLREELHVKDVVSVKIGPVIGAHTGPGAIGFGYFSSIGRAIAG